MALVAVGLLLPVCLLAAPLSAGTVLFDFESEAELTRWHDERGTGNLSFPVSRSERFATSGNRSLCFRSPRWRAGQGEWPAVELVPPLTDWSGYDRLTFDVTNPTAYPQQLMVFLSDDTHPTRSGFLYRMALPAFSYHGAALPLAVLKSHGLALNRMRVMHWFTERPPGDLELYLDQVRLLKAGDPRPEPPIAFLKQFGALQAQHLAVLRQKLADTRQRLEAAAGGQAEVLAWTRRSLDACAGAVDHLAEQVRTGDRAALQAHELQARLETELARLEALVGLRLDFVRRRAPGAVGRSDVVVGFATAMEKVLPRGVPPTVQTQQRMYLALARNEKESFQVVVVPCEQAAKAVQVRVSDLIGKDGAVLAARQIDSWPVGYVQTKTAPPYGSPHVGWWPDPILSFLSRADIAAGDAQSFWIRVRAPLTQPPGHYRGRLEVLEDGHTLYTCELTVEVYPFAVPSRSPLNLAVTWWPMYFEPDGKGGWREGTYRDQSWRRHKLAWADFLADYYLTYDSLYSYGGWAPDFEVLEHLHRAGRLGMFNLGYYGAMPEPPAEQEAWKADVRRRIGEPYRQAKARGLLDHAYIYGCDENPEKLFGGVERAAAFLKLEFPGALVLTTTYDHSFGTSSVLQSMDGFCPLTPSYKLDLAQRVRAGGKQVWWYICCGPLHPHANMFVEYPAIDGRILMGAQTAKFRPDGFLYYQTSIWNGKPIASGPFTDWDPRSWTTYHGDGSWTCLGPDGTPLPTIRLENFRDGLEDYAYARVLGRAVQRVASSPQAAAKADWLAAARRLLEVPDSVVHSMTEYTKDPQAVYGWRKAMAEAIMRSGLKPGELVPD